MSKEHFYFSKSDRRACVALLIIIVLANFSRYLVKKHYDPLPVVQTDTMVWKQTKKSYPKKNYDDYSKNGSSEYYKRGDADKTVYKNSSEYSRDAGRKYYGENGDGYYRNERYRSSQDEFVDSVDYVDSVYRGQYVYVKKLPFGTVVDINTADTSLLKRIPGIGSYYARRIVEYRSSLGGYTDVAQLSEIKNMPDSVRGWFETGDSIDIIRIEVNSCTLQQLMTHPYISFYQARAITDYRRAHGDIKSLSQLSMLPEFSDADIRRLSPYLKF